ncbi:MAG: polyphosphate kinase 2 [Alphaproteobacteria bacterium]|nr:polyphosphate kinase 2 [Alphaproteobacteria bacterium]
MAHRATDDDNGDEHYKKQLYDLQVELVKLQRELIANGERVLVILEGRDGAGKDSTIKRLTAHMSPRETRVFAPGVPSSREETEWYFQRFVRYLPAGREFVIFNRSWYNRAGVERVMGFASSTEVEAFLHNVVLFEDLLVRDGLHLRKYYLDIDKSEQKKRLTARQKDPLKQWKISPIDQAALKNWDNYTKARNVMLERTTHPSAPWRIVNSNVKKTARLELIRDLLDSFSYPDKAKKKTKPDREIVFPWLNDTGIERRLAR